MKKLSIIFLSVLLAASAFSQTVTEYKLKNGIRVFYMKNETNRVDSMSIRVNGGSSLYPKDMSGLEASLFYLMTAGSEKYSYETLLSYFYLTKASVTYRAEPESTSLNLSVIDKYFDLYADVLIDGFLHPQYRQDIYERMVLTYQQTLQRTLSEAYSALFDHAYGLIYEGHPFQTRTSPTLESIGNITLDNIKSIQQNVYDADRIEVVAVTSCDPEKLVAMLDEKLGSLPSKSGGKLADVPDLLPFTGHSVLLNPALGDSCYFGRFYKAPSTQSSEYYPFVLASSIYNTMVFNVVRVKYGACYTPSVDQAGSIVNYGYEFAYRCTDRENVGSYFDEAKELMKKGKVVVSTNADGSYVLADIDEVLEGYKNTYINSFYSTQETTFGMVEKILYSIDHTGSAQDLNFLVNSVRNVTASDIIEVFNKYFQDDYLLIEMVGHE
ncbi:MAG: insulinase family protein [Treponema sp.]|nr:insulinase family protein [Treponema sp.]